MPERRFTSRRYSKNAERSHIGPQRITVTGFGTEEDHRQATIWMLGRRRSEIVPLGDAGVFRA